MYEATQTLQQLITTTAGLAQSSCGQALCQLLNLLMEVFMTFDGRGDRLDTVAIETALAELGSAKTNDRMIADHTTAIANTYDLNPPAARSPELIKGRGRRFVFVLQ